MAKKRQAILGVGSTTTQQMLPHLTAPGEKSAPSQTWDSLESRRRTIHWEGGRALGFSRLGENSETNVTTASRTVSITPRIEAKRCPHIREGNSGDHSLSPSF